jgi:hypothetical protein
MDFAGDRAQWRSLINTVTDLGVPQNAIYVCTSWATTSLSIRSQLCLIWLHTSVALVPPQLYHALLHDLCFSEQCYLFTLSCPLKAVFRSHCPCLSLFNAFFHLACYLTGAVCSAFAYQVVELWLGWVGRSRGYTGTTGIACYCLWHESLTRVITIYGAGKSSAVSHLVQ